MPFLLSATIQSMSKSKALRYGNSKTHSFVKKQCMSFRLQPDRRTCNWTDGQDGHADAQLCRRADGRTDSKQASRQADRPTVRTTTSRTTSRTDGHATGQMDRSGMRMDSWSDEQMDGQTCEWTSCSCWIPGVPFLLSATIQSIS